MILPRCESMERSTLKQIGGVLKQTLPKNFGACWFSLSVAKWNATANVTSRRSGNLSRTDPYKSRRSAWIFARNCASSMRSSQERGPRLNGRRQSRTVYPMYTSGVENNARFVPCAYLRRLRCFRRELAPMRRVGDAISRLLNDLLFFCGEHRSSPNKRDASGIARGRVGWGKEWRAIDRRPLAPYFDFRLTSNSSAILAARKNAMPPACAGPRAKGSLPGGTPYVRVRIRLISATNFFDRAERLGDLLDI